MSNKIVLVVRDKVEQNDKNVGQIMSNYFHNKNSKSENLIFYQKILTIIISWN